MKAKLFLTFLTVTLVFSQSSVLADETGIEVTYPFIEAEKDTMIHNPYMEESFLLFLKENSIYPMIDEDGIPLLYYSENEAFGCYGICDSISMNNYTFGSNILEVPSPEAAEIFKESVVVGSNDIENLMGTINSVRASLADNPEALAEFEGVLLGEQEGYLRSTYFENAYDDVWDYSLEELKKDDEFYSSLIKRMKTEGFEGGIDELGKYMNENFDINDAYDLSNLFSAIENKQIGHMQLDEFMRNALKRISEAENMGLNLDELDLNLDDIDLDKFSGLLESEGFKNAMEKALETMKKNPELFDRMNDLADEMLNRPETKEVFKEAVKELLKHADWESVTKLMEIFSKVDNKQELLDALIEGTSEHMREMVQSGMMDKITEQLEDPKLKKMLMEMAQSFSKGILDDLIEGAKKTPVELAYIVAIAAVIATLIIIMKMKI